LSPRTSRAFDIPDGKTRGGTTEDEEEEEDGLAGRGRSVGFTSTIESWSGKATERLSIPRGTSYGKDVL
jgi:hypothetical protein